MAAISKYKVVLCTIASFIGGTQEFEVQVVDPDFEEAIDPIDSLPTKGGFDVGEASRGLYCCRSCKRFEGDKDYHATHVVWKHNKRRAHQYK